MIILTETTKYEVDEKNKRIRRLAAPELKRGKESTWGNYAAIERLEVGQNAFIIWDADGFGTITSKVVEICA